MSNQKIRIYLKGYDHKVLDQSVTKIVAAIKHTGAKISGPVPLPTRIQKFCVIKSPHVNKDSREQFEMRTHRRLIDVLSPTPQTVNSLMKINVPSGVDIEIKL